MYFLFRLFLIGIGFTGAMPPFDQPLSVVSFSTTLLILLLKTYEDLAA
jgi:hypothetical protein